MRKHEVASAAVDVERTAEELLGHRGALDVPTGPPASPRRIPPRVFALFVRLPEREVPRALLEWAHLLFLRRIPRHLLVVRDPARKPPVLIEPCDAVIHVTACRVGEILSDQLLDERRDLRARRARFRFAVRTTEAELVRILAVTAAGLLGDLPAVTRS